MNELTDYINDILSQIMVKYCSYSETSELQNFIKENDILNHIESLLIKMYREKKELEVKEWRDKLHKSTMEGITKMWSEIGRRGGIKLP